MTNNEIKALAARTSKATGKSLETLREYVRITRDLMKRGEYDHVEEAAAEVACIAGYEDDGHLGGYIKALMIATA